MIRRIKYYLFAIFILVLSGCETDEDQYCFPQRITAKYTEGLGATSVIADYKYEEGKLDHIVWSNYQTHYYSYNEAGDIKKIARKNVQTFRKLESVITYEAGLMTRTDEYSIRLDPFTQEDVDTTYVGYTEHIYTGDKMVAEKVYQKEDSTEMMEMASYHEYTFDIAGNITSYTCLESPAGDTIEAYTYTYDNQKDPYLALNLPFEGETHINNVLEKTDVLTGDNFFHQMVYNSMGYPDQINVKEDSYLLEVITIDYSCK